MALTTDFLLLAANRLFGYTALRPLQPDVMLSLLSGRDTVLLDATGSGKSLTFLLPAMLFKSGITIVISPLIDLMRQFVWEGQSLRLPIRAIFGKMQDNELATVIDEVKSGQVKLLLVAPERFDTLSFQRLLVAARLKVNFVAIDEAHCASILGHNRRPSYARIKKYVSQLGEPPILALSATAPQVVLDDMISVLGMKDPKVFIGSMDRKNLKTKIRLFRSEAARDAAALEILEEASRKAGRNIAFLPIVDQVVTWRALLAKQSIAHSICHGQLEGLQRESEVRRYLDNKVNTMVATSAFGMGIDVPDIRLILMIGLPHSLEDLLQQFGRAGRDGKDSECIVLCTPEDLHRSERIALGGIPKFEIVGSVLSYMHRKAVDLKLKINGYTGVKLSKEHYIDTRAKQNPIMEAQLYAAFAELEEYEIVVRNGLLYELRYSAEDFLAEKTPLTKEVHHLANGALGQRCINLAYLISNFHGKDPDETHNVIFGHLSDTTLSENAKVWWEKCKEAAYKRVLETALLVLHQKEMTVQNGLSAYLRGKSSHSPGLNYGALPDLSPRMVAWAISRLEEEGYIVTFTGVSSVYALTNKGLEYVIENQDALPLALSTDKSVLQRIHHPESMEYLTLQFRMWANDAIYDAPDSKTAAVRYWKQKSEAFLDLMFPVVDTRMLGQQITRAFWRLAPEDKGLAFWAQRMLCMLFPEIPKPESNE